MTADQNSDNSATVPHFTREGDDGRTTFGRFGDVAKHDRRLAAYSDCEEANAAVGVAVSLGGGLPVDVLSTLVSVQHDFYDLASDLMEPAQERSESAVQMTTGHIRRLERAIEHYSQPLQRSQGYVLPGGTVAASMIFSARTIVRRAERSVWTAIDAFGDQISPLTAQYLNRLSALLFVLARGANAEHGDPVWQPMVSVTPPVDQPMETAPA